MNAKIIETKVIAAAAGAGLGAAVAQFLLWVLGVTFWTVVPTAEHAKDAISAVPEPVSTLLVLVVSILGAAIGGYQAPHTQRPDLVPPDETGILLTPESSGEDVR